MTWRDLSLVMDHYLSFGCPVLARCATVCRGPPNSILDPPGPPWKGGGPGGGSGVDCRRQQRPGLPVKSRECSPDRGRLCRIRDRSDEAQWGRVITVERDPQVVRELWDRTDARTTLSDLAEYSTAGRSERE